MTDTMVSPISGLALPFQLSKYQLPLAEAFSNELDFIPGLSVPKRNKIVKAVAGSGKSTTLKVIVQYFIPRQYDVLMVSFNYDIAQVLKDEVPEATVKTYHAYGLWALRKSGINGKVEDRFKGIVKTNIILKTFLDRRQWGRYFGAIARLVSIVKNSLIDEWDDVTLLDLATSYNVDLAGKDGITPEALAVVLNSVRRVLREGEDMANSLIDFDDMLWLPYRLRHKMRFPTFPVVLVDEVQDTNPAQEWLCAQMLAPDGIIAGVGDEFQSIYAFRGANTLAMQNFGQRFGAVEYPLSITYRNPRAIVDYVNTNFSMIAFEGAEWARDGAIRTSPVEDLKLIPGDMMLCRVNAPLVPVAFDLIRAGHKAAIRGKDIGRNLKSLIEQMDTDEIGTLLARLADYRDAEVYKLNRAEREMAAQVVEDKVETILALAEGCNTVFELEYRLGTIFSDERQAITLSTVHKAKGLEAERVVIIKPELIPWPRAKTQVEVDQERNLHYVAVTRAKEELVWATSDERA